MFFLSVLQLDIINQLLVHADRRPVTIEFATTSLNCADLVTVIEVTILILLTDWGNHFELN